MASADIVTLGTLLAAALALRLLGLPGRLQVALLAVAAVAAAGVAFDLYAEIGPFDTIVHAATAVVVAPSLVVLGIRTGLLAPESPPPGLVVLCGIAGAALGGAWEVMEWGVDAALDSGLQEGVDDTMRDLVADTAGGAAGAALVRDGR